MQRRKKKLKKINCKLDLNCLFESGLQLNELLKSKISFAVTL